MTAAVSNKFILSQEGYAELPYCTRALYRVSQWRDLHSKEPLAALATRITCLVIYSLIAVVSQVLKVSSYISLLRKGYQDINSITRLARYIQTYNDAVFCFKTNLVAQHIIPELFNRESMLWKRTVESDRVKIVSHWLGIGGMVNVNGNSINLEGAVYNQMLPSVANSLAAFFKCLGCSKFLLSREKSKGLADAISSADKNQSLKALKKNIQSGKLCLVQTGWKEHVISLAFCGEYLAIGNGGARGSCFANFWRHTSNLQVYKINPSLITESILGEILEAKFLKEKKGVKYFYDTLPGQLSNTEVPVQDEFCGKFHQFSLGQLVGNCALYSTLSVLPFAWTMSINTKPTYAVIEQALVESELFQHWASVRYATHYENGAEFLNQKFSEAIARSRKEKERKVAILATVINSPFLMRFAQKSKFFLAEQGIAFASWACVFSIYSLLLANKYFHSQIPKSINSGGVLFVGVSAVLGGMATIFHESKLNYFSKLLTFNAWKGFEQLSCEEEVLRT